MVAIENQFHVETVRNNRYQWLALLCSLLVLVLHGLFFFWLPQILRYRRMESHLRFVPYFKLINFISWFTRCHGLRIPFTRYIFYLQPSLWVLYAAYASLLGVFSFVQTKDIDYEPRSYIIGKRLGKLCVANMTLVLILVTKNDFWLTLTGLPPDKFVKFHKWVGRMIWALATTHLYLCATYWLDMKIYIMIFIPPQYFGMIAYASLCFLSWASLKWIRKLAFDFFLFQHRVFNFVMLLFTLFHNSSSKAGVILAVHLLVLDRIVSGVISFIMARNSPSLSIAKYETFDDDTVLATIPVWHNKNQDPESIWSLLLPKCGTWKAGSYVFLTIPEISSIQKHPFTIASLPESNEIKLLIRKKKGFTKNLHSKTWEAEYSDFVTPKTHWAILKPFFKVKEFIKAAEKIVKRLVIEKKSNFVALLKVKLGIKPKNASVQFQSTDFTMRTVITGPFSCHIQPLITFDSVLFFSAGSGGSYTFPLCLDLLQNIKARNVEEDFSGRPLEPKIHLVWSVQYEKNFIWYKHILDKLEEFLKDGSLKMSVYVTRECTKDEISYMNLAESSNQNPESSKESKSSKYSKDQASVLYEKIDTRLQSVQYAKNLINSKLIQVAYMRCNIKNLMSTAVAELSTEVNASGKSLATIACGPKKMSWELKLECQRNRKFFNSPDIYCHVESY